MILTTTEYIAGKELEMITMVMGTTVESIHAGKDMLSGLKSIVGGELTNYTKMMNDARAIATKRMMDEAYSIGADAVVGVRYSSSSIMTSASEIMAYGTAVKFIK